MSSTAAAERPSLAAPLLTVERLSIAQRGSGRLLVNDVGFTLVDGEAVGIVGESGSGKSLTARALIRLLPQELYASGKVVWRGRELLQLAEREMRQLRGSTISLLMQDPFTMLNPLQTVRSTLVESMPSAARRRGGDEVARRLEEVGLSADVADRYPFQLSGGMRQRVAIAAALAKDPDLLVADEPTTALDVTTQAEVLALLRRLQVHRGMAMILITHDLRLAFSTCDRVTVMYAGTVAESAPATDLRVRPRHPYALELLRAEPPVTHYVEQLRSIPGRVPAAADVTDICAFSSRCQWRVNDCVAQRPALLAVDPNHLSACLRVDEIGAEMTALARETAVPGAPPTVSAGPPIVRIEQLHKSFRASSFFGRQRTTVALDGVSLDVHSGESVGVVGETGSGKTTIARCILGLTTPDSGNLVIDDVDVSSYRRLRRAELRHVRKVVQIVFQDPYSSLNPARTVGVALREVLAWSGLPSSPTAVGELLERVGLPAAYRSRRPAALSGGERQRVAIARALATRPRLLICDEPVAALDVSAQAQVLELLRQVRRDEGMSMLFITHDLSVVRQMCDRVVVLYRGRVVEEGGVDAILDRPQHNYTRRLRAAVPNG